MHRPIHWLEISMLIRASNDYTHGQRFLTNMNIDCFTLSEERKTCSPPVSITHYLHYMAQIHASQTD